MVGFLASLAAMIMGWVPEGKFDLAHGLLLCASSLVTASLASFVLGKYLKLRTKRSLIFALYPYI